MALALLLSKLVEEETLGNFARVVAGGGGIAEMVAGRHDELKREIGEPVEHYNQLAMATTAES